MIHEGKILGMLFVPWPISFPAAVVSKVYVKFAFTLCLYSNHGTPAWEGRAAASLALCPFPFTVLFCDPCLPILKVQYKSTIFNFPILKIPATLEDSKFCQRGFFFPLRLFYYLSNLWVRQTSWVLCLLPQYPRK